jgi:hypothetical protein
MRFAKMYVAELYFAEKSLAEMIFAEINRCWNVFAEKYLLYMCKQFYLKSAKIKFVTMQY